MSLLGKERGKNTEKIKEEERIERKKKKLNSLDTTFIFKDILCQ